MTKLFALFRCTFLFIFLLSLPLTAFADFNPLPMTLPHVQTMMMAKQSSTLAWNAYKRTRATVAASLLSLESWVYVPP